MQKKVRKNWWKRERCFLLAFHILVCVLHHTPKNICKAHSCVLLHLTQKNICKGHLFSTQKLSYECVPFATLIANIMLPNKWKKTNVNWIIRIILELIADQSRTNLGPRLISIRDPDWKINLGSIRDSIPVQSRTQIEKSIWDQSGRGVPDWFAYFIALFFRPIL